MKFCSLIFTYQKSSLFCHHFDFCLTVRCLEFHVRSEKRKPKNQPRVTHQPSMMSDAWLISMGISMVKSLLYYTLFLSSQIFSHSVGVLMFNYIQVSLSVIKNDGQIVYCHFLTFYPSLCHRFLATANFFSRFTRMF